MHPATNASRKLTVANRRTLRSFAAWYPFVASSFKTILDELLFRRQTKNPKTKTSNRQTSKLLSGVTIDHNSLFFERRRHYLEFDHSSFITNHFEIRILKLPYHSTNDAISSPALKK